MKLLEVVKNIENIDNDIIDNMIYCLEDRKDTVELQEPLSDGSIYDKWEEKMSDLEDIIEDLKIVKELSSKKERNKILRRIRSSLNFHQVFYGGLKRLKI